MAVIDISEPTSFKRIFALLTGDPKPTGVPIGSRIYEYDPATMYINHEWLTPDGNNWYDMSTIIGGNANETSVLAVQSALSSIKGVGWTTQTLVALMTAITATPAQTGVVTEGAITANWQTAETGLVSIGADDVNNKIHGFWIGIQNTIGNLTVRMYMKINGTERHMPELDRILIVRTNGPGVWIIQGSLAIHEVLRVTLQSDNATDNGVTVDFDYIMEAM